MIMSRLFSVFLCGHTRRRRWTQAAARGGFPSPPFFTLSDLFHGLSNVAASRSLSSAASTPFSSFSSSFSFTCVCSLPFLQLFFVIFFFYCCFFTVFSVLFLLLFSCTCSSLSCSFSSLLSSFSFIFFSRSSYFFF